MEENTVKELVKIAKGERTLKEYEKDSGVDAAVISKIISGQYVPQKAEVYKRLTSENAKPRGDVTYEKLLEAAGFSASYMAGIAAATTVINTVNLLPTIALPISTVAAATMIGVKTASNKSRKKIESEIDEVYKNVKKFAMNANAILYEHMTQKDISFLPFRNSEKIEDRLNTYLSILGESLIKIYKFTYIYLSEEEMDRNEIVENAANRAIERLIFDVPTEEKKVSIIVNCKELYDYISNYKGKLSYRGNLSVLFVDVKQYKVIAEEYISYYDLNNNEELLKLI